MDHCVGAEGGAGLHDRVTVGHVELVMGGTDHGVGFEDLEQVAPELPAGPGHQDAHRRFPPLNVRVTMPSRRPAPVPAAAPTAPGAPRTNARSRPAPPGTPPPPPSPTPGGSWPSRAGSGGRDPADRGRSS